MKKYQEHKFIIPFPAARKNEAIQATNDAFKMICKKRISRSVYRQALKQFLKEFNIK
jgi:hypothetical protein